VIRGGPRHETHLLGQGLADCLVQVVCSVNRPPLQRDRARVDGLLDLHRSLLPGDVDDVQKGFTTPLSHAFGLWSPRILTGDLLVTYARAVNDDDLAFKALADPTRRFLLDRLFERDGRTLIELQCDLEMTRFGVMKHLRLLEDAGLVIARKQGREKLHFLNPVPIRLIHDRWIDKYTERHISALADLKTELENKP
jgi:DNA-binding transcriptional ArsR family regulator